MKKSGSSNVFVDGLIMDMNPMVTPNSCLTDALNATIITMNGNENMLLQDMGNGRVETAYLPTGYVPVGTAELGGIIYIVSYNPLIDKCLIGSFPSPERNITSDEVSPCTTSVTNDNFQTEANEEKNIPFPIIKSTLLRLNLLDENKIVNKLMPGDKYKIYAVNGGISGNTSVLSDVKNEGDTVPKYLSKTKIDENHVVDDFPKYITIHVVAIADDGRITYLDDTLKWMNTKYDYYIDELNENTNTKDIDSYRNLVSTAYNIFNSKISGELALLFEVKTIDSFSATWDALVEDNEDEESKEKYPKKATFKWYFNWESSDPKINPAYIILTKSEGVDNVDSLLNWAYETQDEYKYRHNDGFDLDVTDEDDIYDSSSKNHILLLYDPEAENHIWDYTWTPSMKYGLMEWLKIDGQIDLSLLGTGVIYLDEWRYYIQENNFILSWGLSCYPEYNKEVKEVILDFIRIDKVLEDNFEIAEIDNQGRRISDKDEYENKYLRYTISDKKSYSGNYSQSISFGETTKIKSSDGTYIEKNTLYLVAVCAVYGNNSVGWKYIYDYRWLYTTGQWNTTYEKSVVTDFGTLYLDDVLSFSTDIDATESINADTYNTTLTIPDTTTGSILGMKTYAVGYDLLNGIYADSSTVNVNISTSVKNYPELFSIEKLDDADTRTSTIGEKTVTRDPDNSVDALKSSENKDTVKSKTGDSTIDQNEYLVTIKNVLSNNITEEVNNSAVDWFFTSLDGKSTADDSFSFNLYGAIFSRINGELSQEKRNPSQVIRPLLFYEEDFETFNMYDASNSEDEIVIPMAKRVLTISLHNSSGNPIAFTFSQIGVESESQDYTRSTLKKEWNPGDTLSANTWYGSANVANMYSEIMNPELQTAASRSPFCFVIYNLGAKHSEARDQDYYNFKSKSSLEVITYGVGLWVNANECFLPIYDYIRPGEGSGIYEWIIDKEGLITFNMKIYKDSALKTMSQRLALFLMQLYYVDTSITTSVDVILISNIFRLKNYYETWSLDINSELDVKDMNNSIFIKEGTETYSLTRIQNGIKNKGVVEDETDDNNDSLKFLNNISYSDNKKLMNIDGIGTYSHRFTINTDDIYDIYEGKMGMNDFAVIFLCDEQNCKVFDLYNSQYLYVYDSDSSSLLRANQNDSRGKYIYTYGSMTLLDAESNEQKRFLLSTKGDAGESSALMLALKVDEGDLSFDLDKLYLEKIEMYFYCTNGHVEITTNCGSKLPIKY